MSLAQSFARGARAMQQRVQKLAKAEFEATRRSARYRCELIMTEAKKIVPHDDGTLENTGVVTDISDPHKKRVAMKLSFGGPAVDYAVDQHENPDYRHSEGRQWQYLKQPIDEAVSHLRSDIAEDVHLEKVAREAGVVAAAPHRP